MNYQPPKHNHGLPHDPMMALVAPRPIGWISSLSPDGVLNLAPYSFFNIFCHTPAIVGFSSHFRKHSVNNIEKSGEFVCNLAVEALLHQMNWSAKHIPTDQDEFELVGLETAPSLLIKTPRVAAAPVALECVWTETHQPLGADGQPCENYLVFGEVISAYIDDRVIVDGIVDLTLMRPVARCGYLDFATVTSLTSLPRPDSITGLRD